MYDPMKKNLRWAYLAGVKRGIVHTWNFAKEGATQEDYDKVLKTDKKTLWRNIKKFFDEWYSRV